MHVISIMLSRAVEMGDSKTIALCKELLQSFCGIFCLFLEKSQVSHGLNGAQTDAALSRHISRDALESKHRAGNIEVVSIQKAADKT